MQYNKFQHFLTADRLPETNGVLLPHVVQHGGLPPVPGQRQINKMPHCNGYIDLKTVQIVKIESKAFLDFMENLKSNVPKIINMESYQLLGKLKVNWALKTSNENFTLVLKLNKIYTRRPFFKGTVARDFCSIFLVTKLSLLVQLEMS